MSSSTRGARGGGHSGGFNQGGNSRPRGGYSQDRRGGRGGGGRGGGYSGGQQQQQRREGGGAPQKKENILDLSKYSNKRVIVQFQGGRQVSGILKGFDPLQNLVLDDTREYLDGGDVGGRELGLVVTRGTAVTMIAPSDGTEEIEDPFAAAAAANASAAAAEDPVEAAADAMETAGAVADPVASTNDDE